jgi:nicotinamidase-related amidase
VNTLLVIDMQNAWLNAGVARFDRDGVIQRINLAARHIRAQGGSVIFIHHCNADAVSGTPEWELDGALEVAPNDRALDKTACDSFADTELLQVLQESHTRTVFIAGLATEFCVDTTLRAAVVL